MTIQRLRARQACGPRGVCGGHRRWRRCSGHDERRDSKRDGRESVADRPKAQQPIRQVSSLIEAHRGWAVMKQHCLSEPVGSGGHEVTPYREFPNKVRLTGLEPPRRCAVGRARPRCFARTNRRTRLLRSALSAARGREASLLHRTKAEAASSLPSVRLRSVFGHLAKGRRSLVVAGRTGSS